MAVRYAASCRGWRETGLVPPAPPPLARLLPRTFQLAHEAQMHAFLASPLSPTRIWTIGLSGYHWKGSWETGDDK